MTSEVPKADGIKSMRDVEPETLLGHSKSGVEPRPIRKRAFFRALKRGELWAVVPFEYMKSGGTCLTIGPNRFARVISDPQCPPGVAYFMWPMDEEFS